MSLYIYLLLCITHCYTQLQSVWAVRFPHEGDRCTSQTKRSNRSNQKLLRGMFSATSFTLRKEGATFLGSSPGMVLNLLLKINFIIYCKALAPVGGNVFGIYSIVPQHQ